MNLPDPFFYKNYRYILITLAGLCLVYGALRLTIFPEDPLIPFLSSFYNFYLSLPEWISNRIFKALNSNVVIQNHVFIFGNDHDYLIAYHELIEKWKSLLLYKSWIVLLTVLIWFTCSSVRKKIFFGILFLITHFIAVISGMILIGVLWPALYQVRPEVILSPTMAGNLLMLAFLASLLRSGKPEFNRRLQMLKIRGSLPGRKVNEILLLLLLLLILKDFLIPFFDYDLYIHYLLRITQKIASFLNYKGYIEGIFLIGVNGSLSLAKWCLGFVTMYVFAAIIFLFRTSKKPTLLFLIAGLIFLHILNIARLVLLFILVQGENDLQLANNHHNIYNAVVYIFIFGLWIVWFEGFVWRRKGFRISD
jgi:exosortase/archaeosortase family protein